MKLKPIPQNTVVHTPTEAEAKELLAILHENGYEWYHKNTPIPNPRLEKIAYINIYNSLKGCSKVITYCNKYTYVDEFITLAEFKERYCEEEKSLPMFKEGDEVMVVNSSLGSYGKVGTVVACTPKCVDVEFGGGLPDGQFKPSSLVIHERAEEPPLKITAADDLISMAKDEMEVKELNLCELLRGHEEECFYSTISGDVKIKDFCDGVMKPIGTTSGRYCSDGKYQSGGVVCLFPSRALYEQYPLDAKKAWEVWEMMQPYKLAEFNIYYVDAEAGQDVTDTIGECKFKSASDRDKCIEEIKAIINKYSKWTNEKKLLQ